MFLATKVCQNSNTTTISKNSESDVLKSLNDTNDTIDLETPQEQVSETVTVCTANDELKTLVSSQSNQDSSNSTLAMSCIFNANMHQCELSSALEDLASELEVTITIPLTLPSCTSQMELKTDRNFKTALGSAMSLAMGDEAIGISDVGNNLAVTIPSMACDSCSVVDCGCNCPDTTTTSTSTTTTTTESVIDTVTNSSDPVNGTNDSNSTMMQGRLLLLEEDYNFFPDYISQPTDSVFSSAEILLTQRSLSGAPTSSRSLDVGYKLSFRSILTAKQATTAIAQQNFGQIFTTNLATELAKVPTPGGGGGQAPFSIDTLLLQTSFSVGNVTQGSICPTLTSETLCNSADECLWNTTNTPNICQTNPVSPSSIACSSFSAANVGGSRASCLAIDKCVWNYHDDTCIDSGDGTNANPGINPNICPDIMSAAVAKMTTAQDSGNAICNRVGCSYFPSPENNSPSGSCQAPYPGASRTVFSVSTQNRGKEYFEDEICKPLSYSSLACNAEPGCFWNSATPNPDFRCETSCGGTNGNVRTKLLCERYPGCRWEEGIGYTTSNGQAGGSCKKISYPAIGHWTCLEGLCELAGCRFLAAKNQLGQWSYSCTSHSMLENTPNNMCNRYSSDRIRCASKFCLWDGDTCKPMPVGRAIADSDCSSGWEWDGTDGVLGCVPQKLSLNTVPMVDCSHRWATADFSACRDADGNPVPDCCIPLPETRVLSHDPCASADPNDVFEHSFPVLDKNSFCNKMAPPIGSISGGKLSIGVCCYKKASFGSALTVLPVTDHPTWNSITLERKNFTAVAVSNDAIISGTAISLANVIASVGVTDFQIGYGKPDFNLTSAQSLGALTCNKDPNSDPRSALVGCQSSVAGNPAANATNSFPSLISDVCCGMSKSSALGGLFSGCAFGFRKEDASFSGDFMPGRQSANSHIEGLASGCEYSSNAAPYQMSMLAVSSNSLSDPYDTPHCCIPACKYHQRFVNQTIVGNSGNNPGILQSVCQDCPLNQVSSLIPPFDTCVPCPAGQIRRLHDEKCHEVSCNSATNKTHSVGAIPGVSNIAHVGDDDSERRFFYSLLYDECMECPINHEADPTYQPIGNTGCVPCLDDQIRNLGESKCHPPPCEGFFDELGRCLPCPVNTRLLEDFSGGNLNSLTSGQCEYCPRGSYNDMHGSVSCKSCAAEESLEGTECDWPEEDVAKLRSAPLAGNSKKQLLLDLWYKPLLPKVSAGYFGRPKPIDMANLKTKVQTTSYANAPGVIPYPDVALKTHPESPIVGGWDVYRCVDSATCGGSGGYGVQNETSFGLAGQNGGIGGILTGPLKLLALQSSANLCAANRDPFSIACSRCMEGYRRTNFRNSGECVECLEIEKSAGSAFAVLYSAWLVILTAIFYLMKVGIRKMIMVDLIGKSGAKSKSDLKTAKSQKSLTSEKNEEGENGNVTEGQGDKKELGDNEQDEKKDEANDPEAESKEQKKPYFKKVNFANSAIVKHASLKKPNLARFLKGSNSTKVDPAADPALGLTESTNDSAKDSAAKDETKTVTTGSGKTEEKPDADVARAVSIEGTHNTPTNNTSTRSGDGESKSRSKSPSTSSHSAASPMSGVKSFGDNALEGDDALEGVVLEGEHNMLPFSKEDIDSDSTNMMMPKLTEGSHTKRRNRTRSFEDEDGVRGRTPTGGNRSPKRKKSSKEIGKVKSTYDVNAEANLVNATVKKAKSGDAKKREPTTMLLKAHLYKKATKRDKQSKKLLEEARKNLGLSDDLFLAGRSERSKEILNPNDFLLDNLVVADKSKSIPFSESLLLQTAVINEEKDRRRSIASFFRFFTILFRYFQYLTLIGLTQFDWSSATGSGSSSSSVLFLKEDTPLYLFEFFSTINLTTLDWYGLECLSAKENNLFLSVAYWRWFGIWSLIILLITAAGLANMFAGSSMTFSSCMQLLGFLFRLFFPIIVYSAFFFYDCVEHPVSHGNDSADGGMKSFSTHSLFRDVVCGDSDENSSSSGWGMDSHNDNMQDSPAILASTTASDSHTVYTDLFPISVFIMFLNVYFPALLFCHLSIRRDKYYQRTHI